MGSIEEYEEEFNMGLMSNLGSVWKKPTFSKLMMVMKIKKN